MNRQRIAELLRGGTFPTTHWSVVLAAAHGNSSASGDALAELCALYWYPLYAYVRRLGESPEDAKDLVQGFFARVLRSDWLDAASPEGGRFRSWILAALKHHLADERARCTAQKRGSGWVTLSLDAVEGEDRFRLEPQDSTTPEELYDRRWALTVLDRVLSRLRVEYEQKSSHFAKLQQALPGGSGDRSYADIATDLGMSEGAVKVAVHRLRERYRATLRDEIARTVVVPSQVDEEIRHLMEALGGRTKSV